MSHSNKDPYITVSDLTLAAAQRVFNSKNFAACIVVHCIDANDGTEHTHKFWFTENDKEFLTLFEQWHTRHSGKKLSANSLDVKVNG